MALEAAKCPNCAAEIQVPDDREDTFCSYCGSKIKTKAAIGYMQVEVKGKVQIDTNPTVEAKLRRGRETGDITYFKEALDIDPDCQEARVEFEKLTYKACFERTKMKLVSSDSVIYDRSHDNLYTRLYASAGSCTFSGKYDGMKKIPSPDHWLGSDFTILYSKDQQKIISDAAMQVYNLFLKRPKDQFIYDCNDILRGMQIFFSYWKMKETISGYETICRHCAQTYYGMLKTLPLFDKYRNHRFMMPIQKLADNFDNEILKTDLLDMRYI
jgi:DNA-directed RNA polymerase subunit RPC12/RpoP